jgi:BASS family bile acid:Na+ symporter
MTLSLGMVLLSTLLSPITTPITLHSISNLFSGEYSNGIQQLALNGTLTFLLICVVIPSVGGIFIGSWFSQEVRQSIKPMLRTINSIVLLLLCYTNASSCLPQVFAAPDWDFLIMTLIIVTFVSSAGFAVGALIAKLLNTNNSDRASLMFGLGMNNNGTGLVMASASFTGTPMILLPILCYNLVQHFVAGFACRILHKQVTTIEGCSTS